MYTWELRQYIDERNGELDSYENLFVQNTKEHPQITHVFYDKKEKVIHIEDCDGEHLMFRPKPYVKTLKK